MSETRTVTIAKNRFSLEPGEVEERLAGVLPEPVSQHFAVVGGRRYPPKQVISLVTGLDRSDFTTHHARRILRGLGFAVGRRQPAPAPPAARPPSERARREAEALRPFIGNWVAVRGEEVVVAAPTLKEVLTWLVQHDQRADAVFGVSGTEEGISGVAPQ